MVHEMVSKIIMPFHIRAFPLMDRVGMHTAKLLSQNKMQMWPGEL